MWFLFQPDVVVQKWIKQLTDIYISRVSCVVHPNLATYPANHVVSVPHAAPALMSGRGEGERLCVSSPLFKVWALIKAASLSITLTRNPFLEKKILSVLLASSLLVCQIPGWWLSPLRELNLVEKLISSSNLQCLDPHMPAFYNISNRTLLGLGTEYKDIYVGLLLS